MRATRNHTGWTSVIAVGIAAVAAVGLCTSAAIASNSCIECHASLTQAALRTPATSLQEDVHYKRGLACQDCHGGDPTRGLTENNPGLAHDRLKGFVGAPATGDIPAFCARCHGDVEYMKQYNPKMRVDQYLEYRSSKHGKLLEGGDTRVATCVSCHGVHGILEVSDTRSPVYKTHIANTCSECHSNAAYMKSYAIPTNQFELYESSIHGQKLLKEGDLAAPTCNHCHGNHGAAPPGLTSVSNSCGGCHANNLEYFNQSPHKAAYEDMELGECNACHGHHDVAKTADDQLGVGDDATCIMCHDEGDAGYETAQSIAIGFDTLKTTLAQARDLLERAERGGVNVSLGKFDLHSADDALIKARTAIHYFDSSKFNEIIVAGLSDADVVIELGHAALWDLKLRQIGLGFTLPLVLLLALGIYLKIRQIERRKPIP